MWRNEESSRWAATPSSSIRPTSMAHLPPCWLLRFDCGAIAVPREAWCHWSGRWYVPTNEGKTLCVDFISSFQTFRHLSFRLEGLCNRIVPLAEKSTTFRIFSYGRLCRLSRSLLFGGEIKLGRKVGGHHGDAKLGRRLSGAFGGHDCTNFGRFDGVN